MPTVSFAAIKETAAPAETANVALEGVVEVAAVAVPLKQELAEVAQRTSSVAGIEGEVAAKDFQLPRLNLLQKTSELVDAGFTPNTFALNKELPLGKSLQAVVVKLTKKWQQDLPYGSETQPHICDTVAEVREAGGSTEWGSDNRYSELAHVQLLVKAPTGLEEEQLDAFPYEVDGAHWAPCMLTVAKTAYKAAAKPVITAAFSILRSGLHHGLWTVAAEMKTAPMGSWSVPQFKLTGRTSPEMAELVEALNGSEG
jgi:hypothetical protein